jgi:3-deoxy-D-manno-octulosonate 8-phosphate phosphatase (KDO 8-P phosphatase)
LSGTLSSRARDVELRARKIRLVVLDLDGVLTDGRILIDSLGREMRSFSSRDRTGIGLLRRAGVPVVVLAARVTRTLPSYARKLGVTAVLAGGDGLASVRRFCVRRRLGLETVAYVGHDVLALPLLTAVGLAISVSDAAVHSKRAAQWILSGPGGSGITMELGERILRAQGKWASTLGETWRRWD